jgi:putative transposase
MQVLRALAPATDVHPCDAGHGQDGPLDVAEHHALLAGQVLGQVCGPGEVLARLEDHDDGQAARLAGGGDTPPPGCPEVLGVRLRAGPTVHAALAADRRLRRQRRKTSEVAALVSGNDSVGLGVGSVGDGGGLGVGDCSVATVCGPLSPMIRKPRGIKKSGRKPTPVALRAARFRRRSDAVRGIWPKASCCGGHLPDGLVGEDVGIGPRLLHSVRIIRPTGSQRGIARPSKTVAHRSQHPGLKIPPRCPRANAHAERFVLTARTELTDRMLALSGCHLQHVLDEYARHYNGRRPHRGRELRPPRPDHPIPRLPATRIRRRTVLGGLINEYQPAA